MTVTARFFRERVQVPNSYNVAVLSSGLTTSDPVFDSSNPKYEEQIFIEIDVRSKGNDLDLAVAILATDLHKAAWPAEWQKFLWLDANSNWFDGNQPSTAVRQWFDANRTWFEKE